MSQVSFASFKRGDKTLYLAVESDEQGSPLWGWLHNPDGTFTRLALEEYRQRSTSTITVHLDEWQERDEQISALKRHLDAIAEALLAPTVCPRSNCPGKLICDAEYCPLVRIRVPEYLPDQLPEMVTVLKRENGEMKRERIEWATKTLAFLTLLEKAAGATIPNLREAREALDAAIKEQG